MAGRGGKRRGVVADNEVDDGRLIRRPRPAEISAEEQEYWNKLGQKRPEIHCQVCGDSYEGNLDHLNLSEAPHKFKAKVPGVNYD